MFTPPPSPLPPPQPENISTPRPLPLPLSTPGNESGSQIPPPVSSSKSSECPSSTEVNYTHASSSRAKRKGRRMLWLVILAPLAIILSTSLGQCLRHLMLIPPPHIRQSMLDKRDNTSQLATQTPTSVTATPTDNSGVPAIPTDPVLPTPFPQPFETLPANFSTVGCQSFFSDFTQDENFRQCRAFSFLLNASAAFLSDQRNATLINNIIYGTCNTRPTLEDCDARMTGYLSQLENVCAAEIANRNAVVLQAQVGFQSYTPMREVACQQNAVTGRYCYVEAVTAAVPSDIYFYALPLGTGIPKSVVPTCSPCVKSLLAVYALYVDAMGGKGSGIIEQAPDNSTVSSITPKPLPVLSETYPAAARLAVNQCGGTFAQVGLANSDNGDRQARNPVSLNNLWMTSLSTLIFFSVL